MNNAFQKFSAVIFMLLYSTLITAQTPETYVSSTVVKFVNANNTGFGFANPSDTKFDSAGNLYVANEGSHNVLKITPSGQITEIINTDGDGVAVLLIAAHLYIDAANNVYVSGYGSNNVFKITANGDITEIINATGAGGTAALGGPRGITGEADGNIYVVGYDSENVFKLAPNGASYDVSEILNNAETEANGLFRLLTPVEIVVDSNSNLFVTSWGSSNVHKITQNPTTFTEIINGGGNGKVGEKFGFPWALKIDSDDTVYASGHQGLYKISAAGELTHLLDVGSNGLDRPYDIELDRFGNVYVAGYVTDNVLRITPQGVIFEIIDSSGDGIGNTLDRPYGLSVGADDAVYVSSYGTEAIFKIIITETSSRVDPENVKDLNIGGFRQTVALNYPINLEISGGVPPYRINNDSPSLADINLNNSSIRIAPLMLGGLVLRAYDSSGQSDLLFVKISNADVKTFNVIDTAGNSSDAEITTTISVDNGLSNQELFTVGDFIHMRAFIKPATEHVNKVANIIIAIIESSDLDLIQLMDSQGQFSVFTGELSYFSEILLQEKNTIDISRGEYIELTEDTIGEYQLYIGYQIVDEERIYYNADPILITIQK